MSDDTQNALKDVSHTPPTGDPVSAVWERGPSPDAAAETTPETSADD